MMSRAMSMGQIFSNQETHLKKSPKQSRPVSRSRVVSMSVDTGVMLTAAPKPRACHDRPVPHGTLEPVRVSRVRAEKDQYGEPYRNGRVGCGNGRAHGPAPVMRLASIDTPIPFSKALEDQFLPKARLRTALAKLQAY